METKQVPINSINPYEKNAKEHPKKQVKQIAASIEEFGFNQPIVVDEHNMIIVGHGRYEAAKLLELKEVPVIQVKLTKEQSKSYRLADNKLNESPWNMDLVIAELKEISLPMLDLTGFSRDLIIEVDDMDDVVPMAPENAVSKLGDIYELGKHKVICGDSTDHETYKKLMGDVRADMIFTDPPYNVNYSGRGELTSRTIENDNMDEEKFLEFLTNAFVAIENVTKEGGAWYICHSHKAQIQFELAIRATGRFTKSQIIWEKPSATLGMNEYRSRHEPIFYAVHQDKETPFYGDRTHTTIWKEEPTDEQIVKMHRKFVKEDHKGTSTIWTIGRDSVNEYAHPTQKPVELICYAITNSSKADDIVLDPFLGSGSMIIAAEKMDRIGYGVELDPTFVDVIVQRYLDYTGQTEVIKNGEKITWQKTNINLNVPSQ